MKILVVGSGGREHALCWKLKQSPLVSGLFCCPGNPGIAEVAECIAGNAVAAAKTIGADFVVVGPEVPLAEGIVDELAALGIPAFGPNKAAAQLEASKIFCKDLLKNHGIPTGDYEAFDDIESARAYLHDYDSEKPVVVKADGLAAGKGVVVAPNPTAAIDALDELGEIGGRILVEEFLEGPEVSLIALTDGETVVPLVAAQDHKRALDGDEGPNTGGMGCYSPVPVFSDAMRDAVVESILKPTVAALKAEGIDYRGALYAGLMLTKGGPKVLEYNCRFGDPETQVILPRLESDLLPLLLGSAKVEGYDLNAQEVRWTDDAAVCVVMAAQNYPATPRKGDAISGLDEAAQTGAVVFHAGTSQKEDEVVTSGGRVLGVSAVGEDFQAARATAYAAVEKIHFDGAHFRRDIGWRCL
ncbi:MAG TPA: phosphoribosylamine--glycine ligase [Abditibacteriaceae bacterium]|jgi:phosphoribosylamine--glycine ligase